MLGWWLCERQLPSGGLNGEMERMIYKIDVQCLSKTDNKFVIASCSLCKRMETMVNHQWIRGHRSVLYETPGAWVFLYNTDVVKFLFFSL